MIIPEITYTIILIGTIVILLTLYIVGIRKSLRAGSTDRRAAIPALTLGFLLCVYLVLNVREIKPADWAQILLLFGLVVVTGVYALSTARQADASIKMAEEMREQRLTVSQPLVFPDFSDYKFPEKPTIPFTNLGNGPALNLKVTFAYASPAVVKSEWKSRKGPSYSKAVIDNPNWTIVTVGNKIECVPYLTEDSPGKSGTAFVEYSDIYGRSFLTGWGYRCERDDKGCTILQPTEPIYPLVREIGEDK